MGLTVFTLLAILVTINGECEEAPEIKHCSSCVDAGIECVLCPTGWLLTVDKSECEECLPTCAECERENGDIKCLQCDLKYALTSDGRCYGCVDDCAVCHHTSGTDTVCDACEDGFTLEEDFQCISCPGNCKECREDDVTGVRCTKCDESYFLKSSDKTCKRCPTNCQECTDNGEGSGSCTECYDGNVVNDDDPTGACLTCPSTCSSCTGEVRTGTIAKCDECELAFSLFRDECVSCDVNCVNCDTVTFCLECTEGFRVESGTCIDCGDRCLTCAVDGSSGGCDLCEPGWIPTDSHLSCSACPGSVCQVCDLDGVCSTCDAEYAVDDDGDCRACPAQCTECTYNPTSSRTECNSGRCQTDYVLNQDIGTCDRCPSGCLSTNCVWQSDPAMPICGLCDSSVTPTIPNGDLTQCVACPAQCITCQFDNGIDDVSCDVCAEYFEAKDGICEACPSRCKACTYNAGVSAMDCDSVDDCDSGFRLGTGEGPSGNDICVVCSVGFCDRCDAANLCTLCISPYMLLSDGSECTACPAFCTSCYWDNGETETLCSGDAFCESGYGLNKDKKCEACPSQCTTCNRKGKAMSCQICEEFYGVNTKSKTYTCSACPTNCNTCTYSKSLKRTRCDNDQCFEGYADITTSGSDLGKCASCPANCVECVWIRRTGTQCRTCDPLFGLRDNDGTCHPCPDFCTTCTYDEATDVTQCSECLAGYVVPQDLTCMACPDSCTACTYDVVTDSTRCNSDDDCLPGYGITPAFMCDACPYDCLTCRYDASKAAMECTECDPYYVLNGGVCGECPDDCTTCSNQAGSIDCIKCDEEFGLFEGSCFKCPTNCLSCAVDDKSVTQCREGGCKDGYGVISLTSRKVCTPCGNLFDNCALCSDANDVNANGEDVAACYECDPTFVLADDGSTCIDIFTITTCSMYEDLGIVCTEDGCDEGYTRTSNGSCAAECYSCGSTRDDELLDYDQCEGQWEANENSTVELCYDECWVISEFIKGYEDYPRYARGCGISQDDIDEYEVTCEEAAEGKYCQSTETSVGNLKRCWRCCEGDRCNDFGAGSTAIPMSAAVIAAAAIFVWYM